MMLSRLICKIGCILIFVNGNSQDLESRIDSLISANITDNGPGIAVVVTKKGEKLYHKAFGKADIELDVDMKPDHVFQIGSITKQFTACAILKLIEEGKLSLSDDIRDFLPNYPTQGQKITIEHLLNHTSGIKDFTELPEWNEELRRKDFQPLELINTFKRHRLNFMPGERFEYNNTGYIILGFIIEQLTDTTYAAHIEETIFKPLGMSDSYVGSMEKIIPGRASGYSKDGDVMSNAAFISITQPYSAGSILSTVGDLATWYRAVFSNKVISENSLGKALSTNRTAGGFSNYGYGWLISSKFFRPTVEHGGSFHGFQAKDLYFPEDELFVAVFSNCDCFSPDELTENIAALALGIFDDFREIKLSNSELKKYVGTYKISTGLTVDVSLERRQLWMKASGRGKIPIYPQPNNRFFLKVADVQLEFMEENGEFNSLILYQFGGKTVAKRVD